MRSHVTVARAVALRTDLTVKCIKLFNLENLKNKSNFLYIPVMFNICLSFFTSGQFPENVTFDVSVTHDLK